jgi:lantibiotic transport system permease protein
MLTALRRALSAETLKLKRTIAFKMAVLAPLAVVLLTAFMASQAPVSTLHLRPSANLWLALARTNLQFWGLLMLPLYITLETALIAGVDHAENQWKALFARPVPRWTVYVAKLLVAMSMVATSGLVLLGAILAAGTVLPHLMHSQLRFGSPIPVGAILAQIAEMSELAFFSLAIQHWVGLRWRSFSVAIGFGIVAMVTSFAMLLASGQYGAWPQYFPWALPMLVLARQHSAVGLICGISAVVGIAASILGCADFCRRELV